MLLLLYQSKTSVPVRQLSSVARSLFVMSEASVIMAYSVYYDVICLKSKSSFYSLDVQRCCLHFSPTRQGCSYDPLFLFN